MPHDHPASAKGRSAWLSRTTPRLPTSTLAEPVRRARVALGDFRGKSSRWRSSSSRSRSRSTCTGELCALRDNLDAVQASTGVELHRHLGRLEGTRCARGPSRRATTSRCSPTSGRTARSPRSTACSSTRRGFANRATFVIDVDGVIRASFTTAPGEARSLEQYRAALATSGCRGSRRGAAAASARAQSRMPTARAMTSARITNPPNACRPMSSFARCGERHRVGRAERHRVRQREVEVVDEPRRPVRLAPTSPPRPRRWRRGPRPAGSGSRRAGSSVALRQVVRTTGPPRSISQ